MALYVNPLLADQGTSLVQRLRLSELGCTYPIAPDFTLREFACPYHGIGQPIVCGGIEYHDEVLSHPSSRILAQAVRDVFGVTYVTSGYRTETYNNTLDNAVEGSTHTTGRGLDLVVPGADPARVASFCRDALGAGGVGLYDDGHVHVSVGREGGADRRFGRTFATLYTPADGQAVLAGRANYIAQVLPGVTIEGGAPLWPGPVALAGYDGRSPLGWLLLALGLGFALQDPDLRSLAQLR